MKINEVEPIDILNAIIKLNGNDRRETDDGQEPMRSRHGIRALKVLHSAPSFQLPLN